MQIDMVHKSIKHDQENWQDCRWNVYTNTNSLGTQSVQVKIKTQTHVLWFMVVCIHPFKFFSTFSLCSVVLVVLSSLAILFCLWSSHELLISNLFHDKRTRADLHPQGTQILGGDQTLETWGWLSTFIGISGCCLKRMVDVASCMEEDNSVNKCKTTPDQQKWIVLIFVHITTIIDAMNTH